MIKNFKELLEMAGKIQPRKVSVAVAEDAAVISSLKSASDMGFITPILTGNKSKIKEIADTLKFTDYDIIDCPTPDEALKTAVTLVHNGEADVLMKGLVNTAVYMRGILNKEYGLRTGKLLSLLAVYELPQYHKLIYATDSGINVAPTLEQKKVILTNALETMARLGLVSPKTALLAANEMVDPKVASTVDAAALAEMAAAGELPACIAEGPVSFDIAFDADAARHKGIDSKIAGDTDLLLFPNIEAGNIMGKSWLQFNDAKWAGIVLGASAPVILGSRSDTPEIKIHSIALACLSAAN